YQQVDQGDGDVQPETRWMVAKEPDQAYRHQGAQDRQSQQSAANCCEQHDGVGALLAAPAAAYSCTDHRQPQYAQKQADTARQKGGYGPIAAVEPDGLLFFAVGGHWVIFFGPFGRRRCGRRPATLLAWRQDHLRLLPIRAGLHSCFKRPGVLLRAYGEITASVRLSRWLPRRAMQPPDASADD